MWEAISSWWQAFVDFLASIPTAIYDGVLDVIKGGFDMISSATSGLLSGIDLSRFIAAKDSLPAQLVEVARMVGAGEALLIVMGALLVRFILQLIPLVRLGS